MARRQGRLLGFVPLPPLFLAVLAVIAVLYIAAAEVTKKLFYARFPE